MLAYRLKSHHMHMPLRWRAERNDKGVARSAVNEPGHPHGGHQADAFGEERPGNEARSWQWRHEALKR
jgi:hypothetical protein